MIKRSYWLPLTAFKEPFSHRDCALNREEFHQIIHYERLRADRTDSRFTLVNIELDFETVTRYDFRRFLSTLFVKLRDIDQAGWFSDDKIGVLLPDTTISGAQAFMKSFHGYANEFKIVKSVEFSMYPRVSNIKMVVDEEDEEPDYYSTYDNRLNPIFQRQTPPWKRSFDVAVSILTLIAASPVFLLLALYIPLSSRGPFFYVQERVGLGGRLFRMIKFRTLRTEIRPNAPRLTYNEPLRDSENVIAGFIPGGPIIRRLGLDNLPQLFNVLRGEMSIVGPRPCMKDEAEIYLHWHKRRFDVSPGIVGLWHIKGKNRLSLREKIRLDIDYADSMTFWTDLKILIMLIPSQMLEAVRTWKERRASGIASLNPNPDNSDDGRDSPK